jgi:hypothetical protein
VVALTQPPAAVELVRSGLSHLRIERARAAAGPEPAGVLDLSDQALKAMCDRNGWLLGSPTERTQRELVQRGVPADAGEQLREQIAAGAGRDALERIVVAGAADDATLDRRAYRKNPPAADVTATQTLLAVTGAEALSRFADFTAEPRTSYAEAFAHRFPARLSRGPLTEADPSRLIDPTAAVPAPPDAARALAFDFGL